MRMSLTVLRSSDNFIWLNTDVGNLTEYSPIYQAIWKCNEFGIPVNAGMIIWPTYEANFVATELPTIAQHRVSCEGKSFMEFINSGDQWPTCWVAPCRPVEAGHEAVL